MEKRKYNVGDRVRNWDGIKGTVIRVWTITEGCAPHHRLEMIADSGQAISRCEGAEYNFHPVDFYQVYEGDTLRANQSTRAGAEHYMKPGRVLVGPGEKRP